MPNYDENTALEYVIKKLKPGYLEQPRLVFPLSKTFRTIVSYHVLSTLNKNSLHAFNFIRFVLSVRLNQINQQKATIQ